jgi:hypothetical protein
MVGADRGAKAAAEAGSNEIGIATTRCEVDILCDDYGTRVSTKTIYKRE